MRGVGVCRCVGGSKSPCPIHYYQNLEQSTSCKPCTTTGDVTGKAIVNCGSGNLLAWCDPMIPYSQTRSLGEICIPCKQCIRVYLPLVEDQQNCYNS